MKKISTLGLLLLMLLGFGLNASAYSVTLQWDNPGAIKLYGASPASSQPIELSDGQTSYVFEYTSSAYVYVVANDGYSLSSIQPYSTSSDAAKTTFSVSSSWGQYWSTFAGSAWDGKTINVTTSKLERNANLSVNVVNGAEYLTAQFSELGYNVTLQNGQNYIPFAPGIDKTFFVTLDTSCGKSEAYSFTRNGNPVSKNAYFPQYTASDVTAEDQFEIQVFAPGETVESCELTVSLPAGLEDCISSIRDWGASKFVELENGKLSVTKGSDIQLNFKEDFTFTKFMLGDEDITESYNSSSRSIRFTVNEDVTIYIEGSTTTYEDVTFKAYVQNPEGVIFYIGKYQQNPMELTDGHNISTAIELPAQTSTDSDGNITTFPAVTLDPATTQAFAIPVSEKSPYIYIAPKEGWYIQTVQATEGGDLTNISSVNTDYPTFYVSAAKYDLSTTANVNVVGSATLKFAASTALSNFWDNPTTPFTLSAGDNSVKYMPGYHNPFTVRSLETITGMEVYVDGIAAKANEYSTYTLDLYSSDGITASNVQIYADGKTKGTLGTITITAEGDASYESFYGEGRRPNDAEKVSLLVGTPLTIKPANGCIVKNGDDILTLDDNGEYVFSTTAEAANFTVCAAPANLFDISTDPADGATVKSISSITAILPCENDEEIFAITSLEALNAVTITSADNANVYHASSWGELEPVYNDRWQQTGWKQAIVFETISGTGEYTLNIPEGTFCQIDWNFEPVENGKISAAYEATLTVDPNMKSKIDTRIISPAEGSALKSLSIIYINLPEYDMYDMTVNCYEDDADKVIVTNPSGDGFFCQVSQNWEGSTAPGRAFMVFPVDYDYNNVTITEAGEWTLEFDEGVFFTNSGEKSEAFSITFTVGEDYPVYPITPVPGSVTGNLSKVNITFPGAYEAEFVEGTTVTLTGDNFSTSTTFTGTVTGGHPSFDILFTELPYVEGDYTVTIPAGAFTVDGMPSVETKATFHFKPIWKLTPTPNTTVESLSELILEFPDATSAEFVGEEYSFILTNGSNYASAGFTSTEVEDAAHPTFKITLNPNSQIPPIGGLTFMIEAGAYIVDGEAMPEIKCPFTLDRQLSTDYEVTPSGNSMLYDKYGCYWAFIFEEGSVVRGASDIASKVSVKIGNEELTYNQDYMVMFEGNNMVQMGIINPDCMTDVEGKVLSVNIEAGAFNIGSTPSPVIEHSWTFVAPKTYLHEITPAHSSVVSQLTHVIIAFPEAETAEVSNYGYGISLVKDDYSFRSNVEIEEVEDASYPTFRLTFTTQPSDNGTYNFTARQGEFTIDGIHSSPEINATYTIDPTSGIGIIEIDGAENVTVVSIDGRIVLKDANSSEVKGLAKGIYIINGKKVMIK